MSVILHVWKVSPDNVGHVSLQVGTTYISYWPNESAGKSDVKVGSTHGVMFPPSYAHDRKLERKACDETLELKTLDTARIEQAWAAFRQGPRRYNLLDHNCSTVIASLLRIGSGVEPSFVPGVLIDDYASGWTQRMLFRVRFFSRRIRMWTPDDVLRYALEIEARGGPA